MSDQDQLGSVVAPERLDRFTWEHGDDIEIVKPRPRFWRLRKVARRVGMLVRYWLRSRWLN
jgi:hypothetical protein